MMAAKARKVFDRLFVTELHFLLFLMVRQDAEVPLELFQSYATTGSAAGLSLSRYRSLYVEPEFAG